MYLITTQLCNEMLSVSLQTNNMLIDLDIFAILSEVYQSYIQH
jgi:hypothetical protein